MNQINYNHLGGMPIHQRQLAFMQEAYNNGFGAIAKLCGDKTIISGVEAVGGSVSNGWISYNGELIYLEGGAAGAEVKIFDEAEEKIFADNASKDVYHVRVARLVTASGDFAFSDLQRLQKLVNIWKKDDIRICYKGAPYVAANFDANGYGVNEEIGWRILSKAVPEALGKVFVNLDEADADFNEVGKVGGGKTFTIQKQNLPNITDTSGAQLYALNVNGTGTIPTAPDNSPNEPNIQLAKPLSFSNTPIKKQDPYMVMLHLIKL